MIISPEWSDKGIHVMVEPSALGCFVKLILWTEWLGLNTSELRSKRFLISE